MPVAKSVDEYLDRVEQWAAELRKLVQIMRSTGLEESIKWGAPAYSYKGKNVLGLSGFKSYFGVWFHQGALLDDPDKVLVNAQEGKTRAMRQWRMTKASEIKVALLKKMIKQSIALVERGVEIKPQRKAIVVDIPEELAIALSKNSKAAKAFETLTPGCKKEYCQYIEEAKRAETKQKRIEKILPMIQGKQGLNDRYRNC